MKKDFISKNINVSDISQIICTNHAIMVSKLDNVELLDDGLLITAYNSKNEPKSHEYISYQHIVKMIIVKNRTK